jgi:hypothetical protein
VPVGHLGQNTDVSLPLSDEQGPVGLGHITLSSAGADFPGDSTIQTFIFAVAG